MVGAHESYIKKLMTGAWQGFSSSLDSLENISPSIIKQQMKKSDEALANFLKTADLQKPLQNGQPAYEVLVQMIKHEMHHHGQLINYMYCHHLPIPDSWHGQWALSRD